MKYGLSREAAFCLGLSLVACPMHGQVSFFQPPSYAGNFTLFAADFNGDGKPDLLSGDGTLQLGNGDGTFSTGTSLSGTPLAVADFNGDGRPDVLETSTGTLLVLLGDGDGTFQAPVTTASGAALQPVAAADLNGDGKADVVGVYGSSLLVYLSKGDGTFQTGVPYSFPPGAAAEAVLFSIADFNQDGTMDVAVMMANAGSPGQEIVFLGKGDGTFQPPVTSAGILSVNNVVVGDFNGDGKTDLLLSDGPDSCSSGCSVFFLAGNGDGTFEPPALSISNLGGVMAAADLNGDGKLDLTLEIGGLAVQTYSGNGDGTFSRANTYWVVPSFSASNGAVVADFNSDGKPDIAAGNSLLLGNGDGTLQAIEAAPVSSDPIVFQPAYATFAAVGNFDRRRNVPGVAVSATTLSGLTYSFSVEIFANDGHGGLSLSHSFPLDAPISAVATGDFDSDGNVDLLLVTSDATTGNWAYDVLLGNGDGSFESPVVYPQNDRNVAPTGNSIQIRDFNHDGKLDVAVGGLISQSFAILPGNGDGTFAPAAYFFAGGDTSLVSADFNGDGNLDVAAAATVGEENATSMLAGNGDGTFQAAVFPSNLGGFSPLFSADLNNDGKADLVSNRQVALGNGDGTFNPLPLLPYSPIAPADFNGDGNADLFVFLSADQTGVVSGNGDGTFSSPVNVPRLGSVPTPLLIADMNNDGRPDIVFLSNSGFRAVGVLLNTTPPNFSISGTALSPTTVTAGSSTNATIGIDRDFGFSQDVLLTCSGLPTGAACTFTPPSLPAGTATSSLAISTDRTTAAGTYSIKVVGSAGILTSQVVLSLAVRAAPDFTITGPSTTSQSVSAGQSAKFVLSLAPAASFSSTVALGCAIAPVASPAPTCALSSASVQLSGTAPQTVDVTIGTTAPVTTNAQTALRAGLPVASLPLLLLLRRRSRKRISMLAALLMVAAIASLTGCGTGGMSSGSRTTPGTPAGTYTITVTATSGTLVHDVVLQVIVK